MKRYVKVFDITAGIKIETDSLEAEVTPNGKYRTGVLGGTFLDKKTGARDIGFDLNVTDMPVVSPSSKEWEPDGSQPTWIHGTKRLFIAVEGPQLCRASNVKINYEVIEEKTFVLIHEWFTFTKKDNIPGSRWDEWLLFPSGKRYFFAFNKLTSGDKYFKLALAGDWPGHIMGDNFDKFENIYLSYHGVISKDEFPKKNFPPETKFFYHRDFDGIPDRMIRGYQITVNGKPGPWLASLTLDPSMLYQAWCHRRGHICFIGMIGGFNMCPGDSFSNVNLIGYFDSIEQMNDIYDKYRYSSRSIKATDFFQYVI